MMKATVTTQLTEEIFRYLTVIVTDEGQYRKAAEALRVIAEEIQAKRLIHSDTTERIEASPAMMEIIRRGDEEIARGETPPIKLEDLWK